ncbi:phage tail assembly chaperone [Sphingomonas sp. Leaf242]|uniref:phage tail assembly chaperone n=1 Tax=Sphingomonas sp. Leaf242 TaxID=1736304 RepID=UPI000AF6D882|nr:phage tail assembly chaperone [Sphingomonas sp. Leaf242]
MANLLSREAILAAPVVTTEVEVPEWGGSVLVRALSLKARMALLDAIYANDAEHTAWKEDQAKPEADREGLARVDLYDQSILTVIHAIVDETGEQVFTVDDYDRFAAIDYDVIKNIWVAVTMHSRRDPEALKKNSGKTRTGGSSSGSRSRSAKP